MFCHITTFFFGIFQHLPLILDVILPLNGSRPYQIFLIAEYFVNQDQYIQVILLHELLVGYVGWSTMCGIAVTILIYVTHVCALLEITR